MQTADQIGLELILGDTALRVLEHSISELRCTDAKSRPYDFKSLPLSVSGRAKFGHIRVHQHSR